jgi:GT2 family glycosyltransferase
LSLEETTRNEIAGARTRTAIDGLSESVLPAGVSVGPSPERTKGDRPKPDRASPAASPRILLSPRSVSGTSLWLRRVGRAWQSIHERVAWEPLPLTPLVATAAKHSSAGNPDHTIQVVGLKRGGSEIEYGILARPYSRLSFRVRLGHRPRFTARIDVLDRDLRSPALTEFLVEVEADGSYHRLVERSLRVGEYERRRRLSVDLGQFAGQDITLVLRTRSVDADAAAEEIPTVWGNPRIVSRRDVPERISRLRQDIRRLGLRGVAATFVAAMKGQLALNDGQALYQLWIERNSLTDEDIARIRAEMAGFASLPKISIVTPVYNTEPQWLRKCIESVRNQLYPNWELCLADDASTEPWVGRILKDYANRDKRIRVTRLPENEGIAGASNAAMKLASGDFVGLLDHDDELAPDALYEVASLLQAKRDADVIYTDEDKMDPDGTRTQPFFKPDWSPEYLLSCMYTCHFTVYRREVLDRIGGFRPGFEGSQDYDLMLRASRETRRIHHVPKVLYHWRRAAGSAADTRAAKPYAYEAGKRALKDHLERQGGSAALEDGKLYGLYRVRRPVDPGTRVSIVILTRDNVDLLRACIGSIRSKTTHPNYEILVVDNNSTDPRTEDYLSHLDQPVLRSREPFNFSRLNNFAASRTTGEYLLFLNNDTEVITPEWLTAMLEFCRQPEIGVVGAKLLFPDGRIQHAGITLGLGGVAGHHLTGFPAGSSHYFGLGSVIRNCSAVTGACLMTRREVFDKVGGFDEGLPMAYNDVDFCLRVREKGLRVVWTPFAELYHRESASRDGSVDPEAVQIMRARWGALLDRDPYYNPNLTREHSDLRIRI